VGVDVAWNVHLPQRDIYELEFGCLYREEGVEETTGHNTTRHTIPYPTVYIREIDISGANGVVKGLIWELELELELELESQCNDRQGVADLVLVRVID